MGNNAKSIAVSTGRPVRFGIQVTTRHASTTGRRDNARSRRRDKSEFTHRCEEWGRYFRSTDGTKHGNADEKRGNPRAMMTRAGFRMLGVHVEKGA